MVKTILALLAAIAPLAIAKDKLQCAIDGASALDAATNAGVFIYASSLRCDKKNAAYDEIRCAVDVMSVAQSVNSMANVIVGAVETCGDISKEDAACGRAAGVLTAAVTGLGANSAGLAHWVKKGTAPGNFVMQAALTKTGKCVMNLKGVVNGIMGAAAAIKATVAGCDNPHEGACAADSLKVMSALSNIGAAIAHSITYCADPLHTGKNEDNKAYESGDVLALFSSLNDVSAAAIGVSQACAVSDARLYEEDFKKQTTKADTTTIVLNFSNGMFLPMAFVPIALLIGFVGGRRMGKTRFARSASATALGDETDDQRETQRLAAI